MSDDAIEFEGGEAPCSEKTIDTPVEESGLGETGASSDARPTGGTEEKGRGLSTDDLREMVDQIPPEFLAPDLPVLLASMAGMLEEQAWRHLGLVANPVTHQAEKDLPKAKIAIDVVAFIVSQVSPLVSDSQRRDLQNRVSTLQMNFVEQSRKS